MLIDATVKRLRPRLKKFLASEGTIPIAHITPASSVFLAHAASQAADTAVVHISDTMESLDTAHRDLHAMFPDFEKCHMYFPASETLFNKSESTDPEILGFRLNTMNSLIDSSSGNTPMVITTCIQAIMQKCIGPEELKAEALHIRIGDELEHEEFTTHLSSTGYDFSVKVIKKTEACVRGGIIDIWPPSENWPLRIELFGTTVESIRQFDPETQISHNKTDSILVMPAHEYDIYSKNAVSILDFLPDNTIFIWSDYDSICDYAEMLEDNVSSAEKTESIISFRKISRTIKSGKHFLQVGTPGRKTGTSKKDGLSFLPIPHPVDIDALTENAKKGLTTEIILNTEGSLNHFLSTNKPLAKIKADNLEIRQGVLSEGFYSPDQELTIVAESDLHGHRKLVDHSYHPYPGKNRPTRSMGHRISDFNNLEPGDLVVHSEYGLGQYQGLFEIDFNGKLQEVLTIEYANKAKLHVPVSHSNLLTRYVGTSKGSVRLHQLHGSRWNTLKDEAKESVLDLAASLLETQAERDLLKGHAFKPDTSWQIEFEASFPYHETVDQHRVIQDVKLDMEKSRPMDRLICGDAGYGKTEVAMRAVFKAVMEGKQVAVLVPTTVLALQHYQTFADRMSPYPVRIEMLSRFCSKANQNKIIEGLEDGTVDVVIGTHALLQPGIDFKDLGLVVIDKEQRFGVAHKEHFKEIRKLVDVLTMTATPIPRTLYMSMTGARDISLLQTPPRERMSIKTIVSKSNDKLIREAIMREINRGGQVFFLHNRVRTIETVHKHLNDIVPEAQVRVGHGQMPATELSSVMRDFADGQFNVLLSTTIIESGMDIPRANTIIIDRADRFGIADLYQLRGRVGRSSRQAYAYLLTPSSGRIEPEARRRINAVKKYSGLSAGFSLAIRDLEIRGAGNLLGAKQSGHITAIGFNLYCQLLKKAVARLSGHPEPEIVEVEVIFDFICLSANSPDPESSAAIPYDYIEDETMRIDIYKRFAELSKLSELKPLRTELTDRFGKPTSEVNRLLLIAEIRLRCAKKNISSIETKGQKLIMKSGSDYIKIESRFPQLKKSTPDGKLKEIIDILKRSIR